MRRILTAFFSPETPPTLASDLKGFAIILSPIVALVVLVNLFG